VFSIISKGNYRERNYAEMFVDSSNFKALQDSALVWKGEAYVADIKNVLVRFLGEKKATRALKLFFAKYKLPQDIQLADSRLINFSEKLLTGSIGSASAKILIASVVKEEQISLVEVLRILEESKDNIVSNKMLLEKSDELSELSSKLKDANKELVVKDKQKDEFLDTVAHELKTPITGIRAATELLMDEDDDMPKEIKKQFLTNILQDSDRLGRLINNILDFEKLETRRLSLDISFLDIQETIKKAVERIQPIAAKKQIRITVKNVNSYKIHYDEDRILQVLYNLISNAIKFCDSESGYIEIDTKLRDELLEIAVSDNGKGVPEEDIDYIFDKFYQSQHQNTIKPEGSGLGLAITKQIVEKHNGKIWASKEIKSGAKFVFTLPIS
jgi:signal transduction histidine kinase